MVYSILILIFIFRLEIFVVVVSVVFNAFGTLD